MSSPVIIDDGGSTRIKQLKDNANMDSLLDQLQGTASDPFENAAHAFACVMKVRIHDDQTANQQILPPGGANLNAGDTVAIVSANGQVATLTFNGAHRMVITLSGAAGVPPAVEARQEGLRRCYHVANAGPIQTVTINPAPGVVPVFDVAVHPSIYTMVHFI